jgi:hypothetical protein
LVFALLLPFMFVEHLIVESGSPASFFRAFAESGGIGGGALAFPLLAMAGGYAISGRGPAWGRALCGVIALIPIPGWALSAASVGGVSLGLTHPRGAWVAVYLYTYLAVFALASAIPHLPVRNTTAVANRDQPRAWA